MLSPHRMARDTIFIGREQYEPTADPGREPPPRGSYHTGSEKQRAAHSGGHHSHRRKRGAAPLSPPTGCGGVHPYPASLGLQGRVAGRCVGGGHRRDDRQRRSRRADAGDAVLRDLSGGDPGPVRGGKPHQPRRLRIRSPAHRPAPLRPPGTWGGDRRYRRRPAL